jgi:hypothetical protein
MSDGICMAATSQSRMIAITAVFVSRILQVRKSNNFYCHDIHAKFHENPSLYSKVIVRAQTHQWMDEFDTKNLFA